MHYKCMAKSTEKPGVAASAWYAVAVSYAHGGGLTPEWQAFRALIHRDDTTL